MLHRGPLSDPDPPADEVLCPYCWEVAELVPVTMIYGVAENAVGSTVAWEPYEEPPLYFFCAPCDAYIPQDVDTGGPKGTLANGKLRRSRQKLYDYYMQIRRRKRCSHQRVQEMMGQLLHLSAKGAYIRYMDTETCEKAIAVCEFALGAG